MCNLLWTHSCVEKENSKNKPICTTPSWGLLITQQIQTGTAVIVTGTITEVPSNIAQKALRSTTFHDVKG